MSFNIMALVLFLSYASVCLHFFFTVDKNKCHAFNIFSHTLFSLNKHPDIKWLISRADIK